MLRISGAPLPGARRRAGASGLVAVLLATVALLTPASAATAENLRAKPAPAITEYAVGSQDATFVDGSRKTDANGTFQGASFRTLPVLILYPATGAPRGPVTPAAPPATDDGPFPLIVFSHGFMANGPAYAEPMLHALAAHVGTSSRRRHSRSRTVRLPVGPSWTTRTNPAT